MRSPIRPYVCPRYVCPQLFAEPGPHRPERGRNMRGTFILPPPAKFEAFCAELHRLELVAREHRVAAGEAPGEKINFDVCVRTPYEFEYGNGALQLMTASEASLLLPGNPSL